MDQGQTVDVQILLGRNLKVLRKALGLSQQELAELCGISTNYLGSVEIGQKYPSAKTLTTLSMVLRVPVYRFFLPQRPGSGQPVRLTEAWVSQLQSRISSLLTDSVGTLEDLLVAENIPEMDYNKKDSPGKLT